MRVFKKLLFMILVCLLILPFSGNTAYASSGTISLSDPTSAVGDSVSVTVKATTTDSSTISSVTMELTYDTKILEFESGTSATNEDGIVKISGTADSSIKTYTLNFKTLKAGTAAIKISSYEIKDSKAATIEMSKVGSSTVTITGDGTEDLTSTESATQDTQTEDTTTEDTATQEAQDTLEDKIVTPPGKDVKVEIAGSQFYICKITEDIIPEGFEYIGYMYGDVAVDAVRKDNIVLFYLNQIGEEPYIFYLYDDETGGFYKYAPVTPCLSYSVIDVNESVVIPDGFTATEVSVGGVAVNGWQSDANAEYFLLYLMTSEGKKNLYIYDTVEKTVQRYDGSDVEETETETETETDSYQTMYVELNEKYNADMQSKTRFIYVLIVLAVVFVFVIINLLFRLSDKHHAHLEDEEDEEDYLEFDDEENEDYDDQEDFDNDYNDYEEDAEVKSDRQVKKEMKIAAKLEKKEKLQKEKAAKKSMKSSQDEINDEPDSDVGNLDDSEDFEIQIFDFDEDKK